MNSFTYSLPTQGLAVCRAANPWFFNSRKCGYFRELKTKPSKCEQSKIGGVMVTGARGKGKSTIIRILAK